MKVELYTRKDCGFCGMAKEALKEKRLSYSEHVIGETVSRDDVRNAFPSVKFLPIVVIDNQFVGGYNELVNILEGKTL